LIASRRLYQIPIEARARVSYTIVTDDISVAGVQARQREISHMKTHWAPEVEKKYRLEDSHAAAALADKAESLGLVKESYALQKDWIPDLVDSAMKNAGVLLRVRTMQYFTGIGPSWVITLKIKGKKDGVHHNQELEASSDNPANLRDIIDFIQDTFGISVDIKQLVTVNMEYANKVGLTKHRMYIEKRRKQLRDSDGEIILAIDELPEPAGWFAEIELDSATDFADWESRLGLTSMSLEARDYGEIVKQTTLEAYGKEQRELSFTSGIPGLIV
jgi:hypothetical protein